MTPRARSLPIISIASGSDIHPCLSFPGEFTGEPNAQMRWTRFSYMRDIVARYRIRIEGWPLDEVPFKNLSDVPNLPKLELLMRGWKDGTIRFVALSEAEYEEMVRDPSPWIGPAGPDAEGEAEDGNH